MSLAFQGVGKFITYVCIYMNMYICTNIHVCMYVYGAFLVAQMVRNPLAKQKTQVRSLSGGGALEKERATHSSIFAWKIPWLEEPDMLRTVHVVTKSWTRLSN